MEHTFPSHRDILQKATRGLELISDVLTISSANAEDRTCIHERRDPHITSEEVSDAVARHSSRLGLCIDDLCELLEKPRPGLVDLKRSWVSFIASGSVLPTHPLQQELTHAKDTFTNIVQTHSCYEKDDDSSSASDYSDSDTQSSTDDDDDDEGDDCDDDEEDDDESQEDEVESPEPRRRRRA